MYKCHVRPCGLAGLAGLVGLLNRPTHVPLTCLKKILLYIKDKYILFMRARIIHIIQLSYHFFPPQNPQEVSRRVFISL